jgi:hypothetical protein
MIATSVCDAGGKLLFTDGDLAALSGAAAEVIATRVNELNAITGSDPKKDTSAAGPTGPSPSGSPATSE